MCFTTVSGVLSHLPPKLSKRHGPQTLTLPVFRTHRMLDRALSMVPITTRLSDPRQLLKFQASGSPVRWVKRTKRTALLAGSEGGYTDVMDSCSIEGQASVKSLKPNHRLSNPWQSNGHHGTLIQKYNLCDLKQNACQCQASISCQRTVSMYQPQGPLPATLHPLRTHPHPPSPITHHTSRITHHHAQTNNPPVNMYMFTNRAQQRASMIQTKKTKKTMLTTEEGVPGTAEAVPRHRRDRRQEEDGRRAVALRGQGGSHRRPPRRQHFPQGLGREHVVRCIPVVQSLPGIRSLSGVNTGARGGTGEGVSCMHLSLTL